MLEVLNEQDEEMISEDEEAEKSDEWYEAYSVALVIRGYCKEACKTEIQRLIKNYY